MASISPQELLVKIFSKDDIEQLYDSEKEFLPEITLHLQQFPLDYNFSVEPSPSSTGYGTVICLEEGCLCDIALDPSWLARSGGIQRGLGGLAKYWEHISKSPAHVASRNKRLGIQNTQGSTEASSSKSALKAHHSGLSSEMDRLGTGSFSSRPKLSSSSQEAAVIPKKRLSAQGSAGNVFNDDNEMVDKKPRLEPEAGVFSDRGNAPRPSAAAASGSGPSKPANEIETTQAKIVKYGTMLRDLRALPTNKREPEHFQQIDAVNEKLGRLNARLVDLKKSAPIGGFGGTGAGGGAGGTDWHLDSAARQRIQLELERQQQGVAAKQVGNDVVAEVMAQFGGTRGGGGGAMGGDHPDTDGSEDPYDAMNRDGGGARVRGVARTQEFDEFVQKALEGESFEGNANVDAAAAKLGLKSQHQLVSNMTIPLMPHQLIGVAYMKAQEESKIYGGILADEMGLGKTVESIALMCANESRDPDEKTTLIVAPLALLEQWKEEIEEKTEKGYFSVFIYHGPERKKTKVKHLKKYDVVLTTYTTLVLDYPDDEGAQKKARQQAKKNGGEEEDYFEFQTKGPLLEMSWYRIILDEAQNIRNRGTKMSRAVAGVDALFRWCLTGTPVTNSLADLFPLFRFIQLKPWYTWSEYRAHVVQHEKKRGDLAGRRAQAILRSCMLRRKKDSKLDGKELISLPEKKIELFSLEFSEEEREIYDAVEKKAQIKFKKMLRNGTVLKNYSHVLVMLLRLRQLCFHPSLIADVEATLEKKEQTKELVKVELKRAQKEVGAEFVRTMKAERLNLAIERVKLERSGDVEEGAGNDECSICFDNILAQESGGAVTRCSHCFCRTCITEVINQAVVDDAGDEATDKCRADQRPCPICRTPVGEKDLYPLEAFEPSDQTLSERLGVEMDVDEDEDEEDDDDDDNLGGFIVNDDEEDDSDFERRRIKNKNKNTNKKIPKQPNRAVIQDSDDENDNEEPSEAEESDSEARKKAKGKGKAEAKRKNLSYFSEQIKENVPSTKMLWVLSELQTLQKENPDDKVIIISSFTSMLDLMQLYLEENDIKTCRYQGDMNQSERSKSLKVLKKSNKCKVMLLSLKCGGVGLTLTRANRVISLDLAWSFAVEAQAYDRTHRIGQLKPVFVKRLTIANTVEQRIFDLQAKKQGLADASLGEGKAQKLGKMTVQELAGLFGLH
ncbi:uncharacterized protein JCM6883_005269 [Sporobolomyces salmoneus]|uniref:uncharacterized protein n=1 Tax=Sporobolomyces salmoneus TaxID=183962 RepID=UPI0031707076